MLHLQDVVPPEILYDFAFESEPPSDDNSPWDKLGMPLWAFIVFIVVLAVLFLSLVVVLPVVVSDHTCSNCGWDRAATISPCRYGCSWRIRGGRLPDRSVCVHMHKVLKDLLLGSVTTTQISLDMQNASSLQRHYPSPHFLPKWNLQSGSMILSPRQSQL